MSSQQEGPFQNYQGNVEPDLSKAPGGDLKALIEIFGVPPRLENMEYKNLPKSADLLYELFYNAPVDKIPQTVNRIVLDHKSWHFRLCPIVKKDKLEMSHIHINRHVEALDVAPEGAPPRMMETTRELITATMIRFNKGFNQNGDFFKTGKGQEEFHESIIDLAQATILTGQIQVSAAVGENKMPAQQYFLRRPTERPTLEEQFHNETKFFGALNTIEKSIYSILNDAKRIMGNAAPPVVPDMMVFAEGDRQFLALGTEFETDASKRGIAVANDRLNRGGDSIHFEGLDAYEDHPFKISRVATNPVHTFTRPVMIGRGYFVSPHYNLYQPRFDPERMMSFAYYNKLKNDYVIFSTMDMIENCCRWNDDGTPHALLDYIAADPTGYLQQAGLPMPPNGVLDHWIYKKSRSDERIPRVGSSGRDGQSEYAKCEYIGDMETCVLEEDMIQYHGQQFYEKCKEELQLEPSSIIQDLSDISTDNYSSKYDDKTDAFMAGIALMKDSMPDNTLSPHMASPDGSPSLPYRDRYGFLHMNEVLGDDISDYDLPVVKITDAAGLKIGYAVFKYPIEERMWCPKNTPSKKITHIIVHMGLAGTQEMPIGSTDAKKAMGAVPGGYTYERCYVSDKPVGYCSAPALDKLATMKKMEDTRGWNVKALTKASDAMAGYKRIEDIAHRTYLDASTADTCPFFLKTDDDAIDGRSAFFHNEVMLGRQQGILLRRPDRDVNLGGATVDIIRFAIQANLANPYMTAAVANARLVLQKMGYDPANYATTEAFNQLASFTAAVLSLLRPRLRAQLSPMDNDFQGFIHYEKSDFARMVRRITPAIGLQYSGFFQQYIRAWYMTAQTTPGHVNEDLVRKCATLMEASFDVVKDRSIVTSTITSSYALEELIDNMRVSRRTVSPTQVDENSRILLEALSDKNTGNEIRSLLDGAATDAHVVCHISRLSMDPLAFRDVERGYDLNTTVAWPCDPSNPTTGRVPWLVAKQTSLSNDFSTATSDKKKGWGEESRRDPSYTSRHPTRQEDLHAPHMYSSSSAKKRSRASDVWEQAADERARPSVSGYQKRQKSAPVATGMSVGPDRISRGGDLTEDGAPDEAGYARTVTLRSNVIKHLNYASTYTKNPVARIGSQLLCQSRISRQQWKNFVRERLVFPDSFSYSAPFEEVNMGSIMFAKSGCGETGFGFEDMSIQYNATNKRWIGHWTSYMGGFIKFINAILLMKDVSFKGILNGIDGSVNTKPDEDFRPGMPRKQIKKTGFVFSHGPHTKEMPGPFWTVTGKIDTKAFSSNYSNTDIKTRFMWSGCLFYSAYWRFNELNSETNLDTGSFFGLQSSDHFNEVIPQARQKMYDPVTNSYTRIIRGKGLLRNWESGDILSVFNGTFMGKEKDDNM